MVLKIYFTKYQFVCIRPTPPFLAHPAFRPEMNFCHCVASVVCPLSTIHKKYFSLNSYPISLLFGLFEKTRACA